MKRFRGDLLRFFEAAELLASSLSEASGSSCEPEGIGCRSSYSSWCACAVAFGIRVASLGDSFGMI